MKAAKKDARKMRGELPWYNRCVITVEWRVNESKVLQLLQRPAVLLINQDQARHNGMYR
jgi:hypothetical protein